MGFGGTGLFWGSFTHMPVLGVKDPHQARCAHYVTLSKWLVSSCMGAVVDSPAHGLIEILNTGLQAHTWSSQSLYGPALSVTWCHPSTEHCWPRQPLSLHRFPGLEMTRLWVGGIAWGFEWIVFLNYHILIYRNIATCFVGHGKFLNANKKSSTTRPWRHNYGASALASPLWKAWCNTST